MCANVTVGKFTMLKVCNMYTVYCIIYSYVPWISKGGGVQQNIFSYIVFLNYE